VYNSVDTCIDIEETHMELSIDKFGFDTRSLAITLSMFGAQAIMGTLGLPAVIINMTPEKFGLLTVIMAGPLGFTATHVANKLLGKKANAIRVNLALSLKMDAVRGAIFLGLEIMIATAAIMLQL
jgi:hypothetical protein